MGHLQASGLLQEALPATAPLIAVRTLSMALAGTDVEQHRHFATAAETYRRDLMRQMNGDMTQNSLTGESLRIALGLFVILLGYGVIWLGFQERTVEAVGSGKVERASALRQELEAIEAGGQPSSPFADPRSPLVLGGPSGSQTAVLAPGPLTALAIGQSDLLPYYYDVNIYTNESSFQQNGEVENPLNLMVGRFDLAFAVIYLLPLLVLALSSNVLSEEREQGTLALTLSQPVSARNVVTVKLAFRALLVVGSCLPSRCSAPWPREASVRPAGFSSGASRSSPTRSSGSCSRRGSTPCADPRPGTRRFSWARGWCSWWCYRPRSTPRLACCTRCRRASR